jgi:nucleoid-associated protein YgaU
MSVRRFAALTTVLTGGALAALPFYKSPPVAESPTAAVLPPQTIQQPTIALTGGLQALPVPQIAVEAPRESTGERSPAGHAAESRKSEWYQPSPIVLASDETPLPVLPQLPVIRGSSSDRSAATIHEPDFSASDPPPVKPPPPPRRHRIVDGDSLSMLALRYLGDERRAAEILAYNRDVLRDPALLPVGKTILIPRATNEEQDR